VNVVRLPRNRLSLPILVSVGMDMVEVEMEVDTGTSASPMSEGKYSKIFSGNSLNQSEGCAAYLSR